MDGMTILREARTAGLKVTTDGDKLVVRGPNQLAPLANRLLAAKSTIMAALQVEQRTMSNPFANWERTQDEVGRWGWQRMDLDATDWRDFDSLPEVADFTCRECGSAEWWQNLHRPVSVRFCLRCHPPTNARRFTARAAELRQRTTVGANR